MKKILLIEQVAFFPKNLHYQNDNNDNKFRGYCHIAPFFSLVRQVRQRE